jgi:hypothetical protein
VQLLQNGDFYAGRRFDTKALATAYADAERRLLIEEEGWTETGAAVRTNIEPR